MGIIWHVAGTSCSQHNPQHHWQLINTRDPQQQGCSSSERKHGAAAIEEESCRGSPWEGTMSKSHRQGSCRNHGEARMGEQYVKGNPEQETLRNHAGDSMKEEWWRRDHGEEIVEGESWRKNHGGGIEEEKALKRHQEDTSWEDLWRTHGGEIIEACGCIRKATGRHLAPRRHPGETQEARRKHPGGTQEAPRRHRGRQETDRRQKPPRRHPGVETTGSLVN